MEMTNDGVPRHPVYRGIRDDIAKPNINVSVKEVKQILTKLISKVITEKEQNWQFKVKFYKQANEILKNSDTLNTTEDYIKKLREGGMQLKDEEEFKAKNGTWKSAIVQKIDIILKTGNLDGLKADSEAEAIENLSQIPGIGPSIAKKLHAEYNIKTVNELNELYKTNPKILTSKQALGLIHLKDLKERIPREEMNMWNEILNDIFNEVIKKFNVENYKFQLTGSYRREAKDSGDIDVLITTTPYNPEILNSFYNKLVENKIIQSKNVISKGNTKIMAVSKIDEKFRHLDIFYYTSDVYPFALLFTTGSKEFNVNMRSYSLKKGYSLNERNLTHNSASGKPVKPEEYILKIGKIPSEEKDIFNFLDYTFVKPSER